MDGRIGPQITDSVNDPVMIMYYKLMNQNPLSMTKVYLRSIEDDLHRYEFYIHRHHRPSLKWFE